MKALTNRKTVWSWYLLGIIIVIVWEVFWLEFAGVNVHLLTYAVFYSLDILYFLFVSFLLLPWIMPRTWAVAVKVVIILLVVITYALFLLPVSSVCEAYFADQSVVFSLNKVYLAKNAFRCFYLFTLALADWHFRYTTKKAKEMQAQELLLLQTKQRETQLENAYLRAQIDPHLLFNLLNSIYKETHDKAPAAAETLFSLAKIMDYSLQNERHDGLVCFSKDIEHLERLVKLELDLSTRLHLALEINIDPAMKDALVPPLLFTDYIQNVFKHGDLSDEANPAYIRIIATNGNLFFDTRNKIAATTAIDSRSTGISNARRRLEKSFPGRFQLETKQHADEFLLHLNIRLQL